MWKRRRSSFAAFPACNHITALLMLLGFVAAIIEQQHFYSLFLFAYFFICFISVFSARPYLILFVSVPRWSSSWHAWPSSWSPPDRPSGLFRGRTPSPEGFWPPHVARALSPLFWGFGPGPEDAEHEWQGKTRPFPLLQDLTTADWREAWLGLPLA